MKGTGIVRRMDDLGRIVIPKDVRRTFNLHEGDPLEIFTTKDGIILKKYDNTPSMEEDAQLYLREKAQTMKSQYVRFTIDGNITTCEGIFLYKRVTGKAICSPDDVFSPAIGMVYAYCRAFNLPLPESFE